MIGMVGLIEDVAHITTQDFKETGDLIYLIGDTADDFSGSEIQKMMTGEISGTLNFELQAEKENQERVLKAIQAGLIQSAHDLSEGGLAVALVESAFANNKGISVHFDGKVSQLFSESQGRFILSVRPEDEKDFEEMMVGKASKLGHVTDKSEIKISAKDGEISLSTEEAKAIYEGAIPCLMK
jgi:phosphoribosylformylglycinamidine synthase